MRKGSTRTTSRVQARDVESAADPRDREIKRLRTLVAELTRRNELLQEALRRVQGAGVNR
ncbi:MAG TPA: hypothetical protein VFA20_26120 [Myxococcaceae bacterium]|nr:hypothetical protein [Myxococcaceae bacterium]